MLYRALIEKLRLYHEVLLLMLPHNPEYDDVTNLFKQAADAIEELSKKRVGTWHRVKASQRSYSFVCNSCGSMYPYITRCCPNCGIEYIDEEPPEEE